MSVKHPDTSVRDTETHGQDKDTQNEANNTNTQRIRTERERGLLVRLIYRNQMSNKRRPVISNMQRKDEPTHRSEFS